MTQPQAASRFMCNALQIFPNNEYGSRVYYEKDACLLVHTKLGRLAKCSWSLPDVVRLLKGSRGVDIDLPIGASVTRESIKAGRFARHYIRPVKIKAVAYMFWRDSAQTREAWFTVPDGMAIQGLLTGFVIEGHSTEPFHVVYVVTEPANGERLSRVTTRQPLLVPLTRSSAK